MSLVGIKPNNWSERIHIIIVVKECGLSPLHRAYKVRHSKQYA